MPRFILSGEKENLFSLYQVVFSDVLGTLVGSRVYRLEQEVPLNGNKIDIYACADKINLNIYVEVQLIPADVRHMEKVKKILTDVKQGIVIWEALSFQGREHLVKEVVEFARLLEKPLDVLFVEVNPAVIPVLETLTTLYSLDVITNLSRLAVVRGPFEIVDEYRGRKLHGGELEGDLEAVNVSTRPVIHEPLNLSSRLGANLYVLGKIRQVLWFFPGAYRSKSRLDTNAITFGAGDGNTYEISVRDTHSHVKLRISKKNISTWVQLKTDKMMIENRIGIGIYFREERSSYILDVPVKSLGRIRREVLDEVVEIFKRFVEFFTEYFQQDGEERRVNLNR
ncbi:hypothetical protein [Desulfosporosinus hippei]|uniref:Uncharacterized protein n=1 Tax=Desulfosporosinus hippei DSM 8344 TaxID=1121419 RepID=A0A1G8CAC6_9FIRM|nr:hypothetical protein [Desulfosporosinus hippei]SDH42342.1 hypothetical protein SAMN05443529_11343 [Desulfosporosinus hippei DSM 8344]